MYIIKAAKHVYRVSYHACTWTFFRVFILLFCMCRNSWDYTLFGNFNPDSAYILLFLNRNRIARIGAPIGIECTPYIISTSEQFFSYCSIKLLGRPAPFNLQRLARLVERTREQQNNTSNPNKQMNTAAGYQGLLKIEVLKDAGLLKLFKCLKLKCFLDIPAR